MSDEKPVALKKDVFKAKSVSAGEKNCIVHCWTVTKDPVNPLYFFAFTSIHNAKKIRQDQNISSFRFDQVCANIPPTHDSDTRGMHRKCFNSFTNVAAAKQKRI